MTAKLTITLSQDVLKALRDSKTIKVSVHSGEGGAAPARPAAGPGKAGFREGSLPAKLMKWAKGKKEFSVPQVMRQLKIKRGHASMLIAYASRAGAVKRIGRGAYKAA